MRYLGEIKGYEGRGEGGGKWEGKLYVFFLKKNHQVVGFFLQYSSTLLFSIKRQRTGLVKEE